MSRYTGPSWKLGRRLNYSTLETGKSQYDLICPSDYVIQKMIKKNMLETIDGEIENYQKYDILPTKDSFVYAKNSPLISPIIGSLMDTIDQPEDIEDSVSGS